MQVTLKPCFASFHGLLMIIPKPAQVQAQGADLRAHAGNTEPRCGTLSLSKASCALLHSLGLRLSLSSVIERSESLAAQRPPSTASYRSASEPPQHKQLCAVF